MAESNTLEGRCLDCQSNSGCPYLVTVDSSTGLLSDTCCQELHEVEDQILEKIRSNITAANADETVYTGGPGVAMFFVKVAAMRNAPEFLQLAFSLLDPWKNKVDNDAVEDPGLGCSLLCGRAGWLCVEALRCHVSGDKSGAVDAIQKYLGMADIAISDEMDSDEWLYGRAGYLHGCLILRHVCGTVAVSEAVINSVSDMMLNNGLRYAASKKDVGPLMWLWQGNEYLGAAHGVMGILFVLLHVDAIMRDGRKRQLIIDSLDWIISKRAANGNWPAVNNTKSDYLIHFCHGAPGAVHLLCKAYEVLGDSRYLRVAEDAGELVWKYGMLKKGPSLCHGFAGNGYVFLALFRAGRDPLWLERAHRYGRVMLTPNILKCCRTPDNPLSLFEGMAGAGCFLLDLRLAPMTSALPMFEVGWLRASSSVYSPKLQVEAHDDNMKVMLDNISLASNDLDADESEVESLVSRALGDTLGEDSFAIDRRENLLRRRMHSALICDFSYRLEKSLPVQQRRRVRPRLVFDHPSIVSMVRCLMGNCNCLTCRGDANASFDLDEDSGRTFTSTPLARSISSSSEPNDLPNVVLPTPMLASFTQIVTITRNEVTGFAMPSIVYTPLAESRFSRETDGMTCVQVPGGCAWIGDGVDGRSALAVEKPCHQTRLTPFLMDIEPVSVGAYARFLSIVQPSIEQLSDWLAPDNISPISKSLPVVLSDGVWIVLKGISALWPMINVTWYGANAYSLWANGGDWTTYQDAANSCLPTEAQWEYAARGPKPANFPWGDSPASAALLNVHWDPWPTDISSTPLHNMPIADVNHELGVSPFGIRGMAGNVWQWCRDTYDPGFYNSDLAKAPDAWNQAVDGPKSERGGSWVGPAQLARSSYRRGRPVTAKGPCLGFRCIGIVPY